MCLNEVINGSFFIVLQALLSEMEVSTPSHSQLSNHGQVSSTNCA